LVLLFRLFASRVDIVDCWQSDCLDSIQGYPRATLQGEKRSPASRLRHLPTPIQETTRGNLYVCGLSVWSRSRNSRSSPGPDWDNYAQHQRRSRTY
jgi:hypothetical protein